MKRTSLLIAVVLLAGLGVIALVGCGGSSGTADSSGALGIAVLFPPRDAQTTDKDMPNVTESVKVVVTSAGGGNWMIEKVLNRPQGGGVVQTEIDNVPIGPAQVQSLCFDQQAAAGNLVGEAGSVVTINPNQVTDLSLVTDRLAEKIVIHDVPLPAGSPPPALAPFTLEPTQEKDIQAQCYDYDGQVTTYCTIGWASSTKASGLSLSTATGAQTTVTANADGDYQVVATDAQTGAQDTVDVSVVSRAVASVDGVPSDIQLYRYGSPETHQLSPTASDSSQADIPYATFSYQSSNTSVATVSTDGLITAIAQGSCRVTVTGSTATGSAQAQVNVTVTETGGVNVIVQ